MATPAKRTRMAPDERRNLIVQAAVRRFGAQGYEDTRLDDIAADAGVTKPILYRHFASKKDLYLALLKRHADDLPGHLAELPDLPFPELIRAVLDAWLAYARANVDNWRLLFRDAGGDEEIKRTRAAVHDRAREILAAFIAARPEFAIPAEQVEPTAEALSHALASLVLWQADHPDLEREAAVEIGARFVLGLAHV